MWAARPGTGPSSARRRSCTWTGESAGRSGWPWAGWRSDPLRARDAEAFLQGRPPTPENIQEAASRAAAPLNPPGDFRGSSEYRRAMAEVLARRALSQAAGL